MAINCKKLLFFCFLIVLIVLACWKHLSDLFLWSNLLSLHYFGSRGYHESVEVKDVKPLCGLQKSCPKNSFPVYLSTGETDDKLPRLCVSGKYVIKPSVKGKHRGLNAAVVDPLFFDVVSLRNFNTNVYNNSVEISTWIDGILDDDILIMFTSGDASAQLLENTKSLLNKVGSGHVQNLMFQSQWYMITQKKRRGFTVFEKLKQINNKKQPEMVSFQGCVSREIPKKQTMEDEPLKLNPDKLVFCKGKMEEKYKGFCNEPRFEIIRPALLTNQSLMENEVYKLPIYLFASENLEILISSLDNLIHQPGVNTSLITILYQNNLKDVPGLAKIYKTNLNKITFRKTFQGKLWQAREMANHVFPTKKHIIVLNSDVIPSPDFLFFLAQTFPVLEKDSSVSTISGWCSNCYRHEGDVHSVYRIRGVPKYGALVSAELETSFYGEMLAPDVARVQGSEACHIPSLKADNWIERPQDLTADRYYRKMVMLQQRSHNVDPGKLLSTCSQSVLKSEINALYLKAKDESLLKVLECLGVLENQYGEYNGTLRLFVHGKTVLIFTGESPFYKSRPIRKSN